MFDFKKAAAAPAVAALALAALAGIGVPALAQSGYSNGQDGAEPDSLGPSRQHHARHHADYGRSQTNDRPRYRALTVAPRYAPARVMAATPAYNPYVGPAAIVTAPIGLASTIVSVPFRIVDGIFPPVGPTAIIGMPVDVAGRIAQFPFEVAQAPFGGPGPFAY